MFLNYIQACMLCLFLAGAACPIAGQSVDPDLARVSQNVENYFRQQRPGWKHESVPPVTPPGSQPSPYVVIHFWSSEKCLIAEVTIDDVSSGKQPVSCRVKLAIDQSPSAAEARTRLGNFVLEQRGARPVSVGDKGYAWGGSEVVFVKGKFTFWLGGGLDLRVGDFTNNGEFMGKLAKEIADAVPST
ncbi:MAG: hypothetical protein H0W76_02380 [Pyrinomonadaceae bacterium]|nr:hypothetical protein [Pyrinomonadaceae bacterium]